MISSSASSIQIREALAIWIARSAMSSPPARASDPGGHATRILKAPLQTGPPGLHRVAPGLFRQQTALAGDVAVEMKVRANHDRLIRRYPDGKRNRRVCLRRCRGVSHYPFHIARIGRIQGNSCAVCITRISVGRPGDGLAEQITACRIQNVDRHVRCDQAAIKNIYIVSGITACARMMGRRADPNVRWPTR